MEEHTNESIQVESKAHGGKPDIFAPDTVMAILTWVTFFGLLLVLQKFAWKPILAALNQREQFIRDSLAQADQVKSQLADTQASKEKILSEARQTAQTILDDSRKKAMQISREMEDRAKKQADEIVQNAHQEIAGEKERVRAALKRESASMAVDLAAKLLKANLDSAKSDRLIEQYIKEV